MSNTTTKTDAERVLDRAINSGWRKTCVRQGRVYLRNADNGRAWVDLQTNQISAVLFFVATAALSD